MIPIIEQLEKEKIKVPDYLVQQPHPITIAVVGAGGTGSMLLHKLARINRALLSLGGQGLIVNTIDDDIVSQANIGRQLFAKEDIGRYKSVVMTERINRMHGTNWRAYPVRFNEATATYLDCLPCNIFITCVDNVKTRKFAHSFVFSSTSSNNDLREQFKAFFWIDLGNSKTSGQMVVGCPRLQMPTVIDYHPDIEEHEEKDDTPSCSLAEALEKQDLFINEAIAFEAALFIRKILSEPYVPWSVSYVNIEKKRPILRK